MALPKSRRGAKSAAESADEADLDLAMACSLSLAQPRSPLQQRPADEIGTSSADDDLNYDLAVAYSLQDQEQFGNGELAPMPIMPTTLQRQLSDEGKRMLRAAFQRAPGSGC